MIVLKVGKVMFWIYLYEGDNVFNFLLNVILFLEFDDVFYII